MISVAVAVTSEICDWVIVICEEPDITLSRFILSFTLESKFVISSAFTWEEPEITFSSTPTTKFVNPLPSPTKWEAVTAPTKLASLVVSSNVNATPLSPSVEKTKSWLENMRKLLLLSLSNAPILVILNPLPFASKRKNEPEKLFATISWLIVKSSIVVLPPIVVSPVIDKDEAEIAPCRLNEPEFCEFVVRISCIDNVPSSFSKNILPSWVLIASSPNSRLEIVGILPCTEVLFNFTTCAICMTYLFQLFNYIYKDSEKLNPPLLYKEGG